MQLSLIPDNLAVCHLDRDQDIPRLMLQQKTFLSVTYTRDELSIVCPVSSLPPGIAHEKTWRAIKVQGPLNFSLTGVLAALATPLAAGGVPIFVISTFETDYLLVKEQYVARARVLLEQYGHTFTS